MRILCERCYVDKRINCANHSTCSTRDMTTITEYAGPIIARVPYGRTTQSSNHSAYTRSEMKSGRANKLTSRKECTMNM